MNIFDELYFETNEESLIEAYQDFLTENGFTESEFPLQEFRDMM